MNVFFTSTMLDFATFILPCEQLEEPTLIIWKKYPGWRGPYHLNALHLQVATGIYRSGDIDAGEKILHHTVRQGTTTKVTMAVPSSYKVHFIRLFAVFLQARLPSRASGDFLSTYC